MRIRNLCSMGYVVVAVIFFAGISNAVAESVLLTLKDPIGRKASYRYRYSLEYFSNRAELIMATGGSGSIRANLDGEWRTVEEVTPPVALPNEEVPEGVVGVVAKVSNGASRAVFLGQRLTYEQYPYTLDMIDDRAFTWRIMPDGTIDKFEPDFPSFRVERLDMITDLYQVWAPGLRPTLPDKPVSVGDTWTGEHRYERPFASMDMMRRNSLVAFNSTYRVRDIKKRGGRVEVTVDETRDVEFQGWAQVSALSVFYGGKGSGNGRWILDVTRGVVMEHRMTMNIDRPEVVKAREETPIPDIQAEVRIVVERRLNRLEKE